MKARTTLESATDIPRGFVMPAAVERAWWRLCAAVEAAEAEGQNVPCRGRLADYWMSESTDERIYAAVLCRPCPVLGPCSQFADVSGQRWGTWGAEDRQKAKADKKTTDDSKDA